MNFAQGVIRRRGWVVGAWLVAAVILLPMAGRVKSTLEVSARVRGSESAEVERALQIDFASPFATWALLVVTGAPAPDDSEGDDLLGIIVDSLTELPFVRRVVSYRDTPDSTFIGQSGQGTFLIVGLDPGAERPDRLMPPLRVASGALERQLRTDFPTLALRWTGELALNYDLRQTSAAEGRDAELRALPLTLALLLSAFGAVVAGLLPVLAALLAIGITFGIVMALSPFFQLSILLHNVVTMLGLGLGIDYALLTVSRFREALSAGADPESAAIEAARHAGHTILLSGLAVAIGFAALGGVNLNELRSVAVGGLLVTSISALVAATLLPATLSWLGHRVNGLRVRRRLSGERSRRWASWGTLVARYPWRVLAIAGVPVLALAWQARHLEPRLPRGNWLPPSMEATHGVDDLTAMGRSAVVHTVRVVVTLPPAASPLSEVGWRAVTQLGDSLMANPDVSAVHSLPTLVGGEWTRDLVESISPETLRPAISRDGGSAVLDVVPREGTDPAALIQLVHWIRSSNASAVTGVPGVRLAVGGLPALNADYEDAVTGRFPAVIALVVGGTLLVLCLGFRSVLIPLKAVALNLLSVAAAFGALVIVFQQGHGARLLGVTGAMDGVFPVIPVLVFCTVFGMSMDYEVFLVARIAEARRGGSDEGQALAVGLARTGGTITNAAAIMIVVFAAFALGQFVLMKMLGFALAVAVILDATVVRMAIGPALFTLAGRWNWWPSRLPGASGTI